MQIQIGNVKGTDSTYREFLSGVPFMYSIDGMPTGERALIALFGRTWKILRIVEDVPGTWFGDFPTPQAAVAGLASEIHAQISTVARGPQAHDGIAKQGEDGRWTVYQVDFDGQLLHLDGPYEKDEAIARLQALVPLEVGDHWAIDVWGVARTLN